MGGGEEREREWKYKDLTSVIMEPDKSKIYRMDWQARDPAEPV